MAVTLTGAELLFRTIPGGQGTYDDRVVRVESIVLNDDGWTGLAAVSGAAHPTLE
jgi:hypothetical protein